MKQIIVVAFLGLSAIAFAGKQERDRMTNEVAPAVAAAAAKFKSKCECNVKITVDEKNLTTMDELITAKHMAEDMGEGAEGYCTDAPSKKAVCQMKTLMLTKGKPVGFTFKSGAGICTTDGSMSCAWQQVTKVLDK